jgi:hypothetical protein
MERAGARRLAHAFEQATNAWRLPPGVPAAGCAGRDEPAEDVPQRVAHARNDQWIKINKNPP